MDSEGSTDYLFRPVELSQRQNPFFLKMKEFFSTKEYQSKMAELSNTITVEFNDIDSFDYQLAEEFVNHPRLLLEATKLALDAAQQGNLKQLEFRGSNMIVKSNEISSKQFGKLIKLEAVLANVTETKQRMKTATWRCEHCGNQYLIEQEKDQLRKPKFCSCGSRSFENVQEESTFVDFRQAKIKGHKNITIDAENDLIKKMKDESKVFLTGILTPIIDEKGKVESLTLTVTDIEVLGE